VWISIMILKKKPCMFVRITHKFSFSKIMVAPYDSGKLSDTIHALVTK